MIADVFDCDSNQHQADNNTFITSTVTLENGRVYIVEFDGTWSAWGSFNSGDQLSKAFNGPGEHIPPKYHSPGRIPQTHSQFNAEWEFGDSVPPAHNHNGIVWTLDGSTTNWVHDLEPIGGIGATFDATNHVYRYAMVGRGHRLRCRMTDMNRFDDDGIIKVKVMHSGWHTGQIVNYTRP